MSQSRAYWDPALDWIQMYSFQFRVCQTNKQRGFVVQAVGGTTCFIKQPVRKNWAKLYSIHFKNGSKNIFLSSPLILRGRGLSSPNTAGEPRTSFPMADEHLKWIHELFHLGISSVWVSLQANTSSSDTAPSGLRLKIKLDREKVFLASALLQSSPGDTGIKGEEMAKPMGHDRKSLQAPCGHWPKVVPLLRRICRSPKGPGTSFTQGKSPSIQLHPGSFVPASNLFHKNLLLLFTFQGNYDGKASRKCQLLEGSNSTTPAAPCQVACACKSAATCCLVWVMH